ncbi:hypothetical protein AB0M20_31065, partial [Actinoplanes sp. NPDC051633]|uniref:hypothetical protein n=1 Tax=Actinoplanes sp. NPDC051633 TaxID=3155670 RepID=UPI003443DF8A
MPCTPRLDKLTRLVTPVRKSRTKASPPLVSPGTRFEAYDWNATCRPSGLIEVTKLSPLACAPVLDTVIRLVVPARRSRTNASGHALVSPGTRFDASEVNATYRPSPLIHVPRLALSACTPKLDTLIRLVLPPPPGVCAGAA